MLYVVYYNIKKFFSKKLFATVFMLSQIVFVIALLWATGQYIYFNQLTSEGKDREYTIMIDSNNNNIIENITQYYLECSEQIEKVAIIKNNYICYLGEYHLDYGEKVDNHSNENQIIIGQRSYQNNNVIIGEKIELDSIEYTVKGVNYHSEVHIINLSVIKELDPNKVQILYKNSLNSIEERAIMMQISQLGGDDAQIYPPSQSVMNSLLEINSNVQLIFIGVLMYFIICIFNSMLLYSYDINKRLKDFFVFRNIGATWKEVLTINYIESLIYSIIQFLTGLIIYLLIMFFTEREVLYMTSVWIYFIIYIVYYVIITLSIYPQMLILIKKTTYKMVT